MQDFCFPLRCQDTAAGIDSKAILFNRLFLEIGTEMGWDLAAPLKWRQQLQAAGFTDIHMQWINWPVGPWAKGKKNKLIGKLTFMNFFDLLGSVGPLFQKFLEYTATETEMLIAQVRKEMRDQNLHFYQPICFCYAKKPGTLPTKVEPEPAPAAVGAESTQTEDVTMTDTPPTGEAHGTEPDAGPLPVPISAPHPADPSPQPAVPHSVEATPQPIDAPVQAAAVPAAAQGTASEESATAVLKTT
jgi:hypothetical protein